MNKLSKKSKILYLSDNYTKNISGTKISIFNEMKRRNYKIVFNNIHSKGQNKINGVKLLKKLKNEKFTHLWIAHTWSEFIGCSREQINALNIPVLGFGFSDPYDWNANKLTNYNFYATNHLGTLHKIKNKIPSLYFPTACDTSFHTDLGIEKSTDILIFGLGIHPRFNPTKYRLNVVSKIKKIFKNKTIKIFGRKWGKLPCEGFLDGKKFLTEVNKAKISLDLQQDWCPLAHRMFECMASGTPVITRDRAEIRKILSPGKNILVYSTFTDLVSKIKMVIENEEKRNNLIKRMYNNARNNHNISNRVDKLISFFERN